MMLYLFYLGLLIPCIFVQGEWRYGLCISLMFLTFIFTQKSIYKVILKNRVFYVCCLLGLLCVVHALCLKNISDLAKSVILCVHILFSFVMIYYPTNKKKSARLLILTVLPICLIPIFSQDGYLQSIFPYRNDYALFLICLLFLIDRYCDDPKKRILAITFILFVLVFTKSRSAYLFVLIYGALRIFWGSNIVKMNSFRIIAFLGLAISASGYIYLVHNNDHLKEITNSGPQIAKDKSAFQLSGRDDLYKISMNTVSENPWGVGPQQAKKIFDDAANIATPHNIYLKFLVEYGWAGLLTLVGVLLFYGFNIRNPIYFSFFIALLFRANFEALLPFGLTFFSAFLMAPYLDDLE